MLFLGTVKGQHLVKLTQPVIDTTLESSRLLPALALAMGYPVSYTHLTLPTILRV